MSLHKVKEITSALPPALRDQVIGYAESVNRSLPDIFLEIGKPFDQERGNIVVFWAGVRKLSAIISSTFWTLDNSIQFLNGSGHNSIRIGGDEFSRKSKKYAAMKALVAALEYEMDRLECRELMNASPKDVLLNLYER